MILKQTLSTILFTLILNCVLFASHTQADSANAKAKEEKFNPTEVIMHHISDSYYWHFFDKTDKATGQVHPVSIPLPVILFYKGHLDVFMSSKFNHGHSTVNFDNRKYIMHHGKIYATTNGQILTDNNGKITNPKPIDISITKNVASMLIASILLLLIFIPMGNRYKNGPKVPKGIEGFMEPIVLFIKDDIALPNIGKHKYQKYLPYLITVFFFIWFNNMLGLIPTGANVTGNIAVTFTLAVFTMVIINFSGNKNYWKHVFATPGVPIWLSFIMIPVELIGIISKPFALMIRLFANITAGHIIVLSLVSLIFIFKTAWVSPASILLALFIDILELLVAILQAYIFTLLSALFIGLAVQEHH